MQPLWPIMATQGLVIAVLALGAAWVGRRLNSPGWCAALIVGLVMGALLGGDGPLAAIDPIFTGGQSEQRAVDQTINEQQQLRQKLVETGVTGEAVTELDAQHAADLQPLIEAHAAAVQRHHDASRWLTILGASLLLLIAGGVTPGRLSDGLPVALGAAACMAGAAWLAAWLLDLPGWLALAGGCAAAAMPVSRRYLAMLNDEQGASLVNSVGWWLLTAALAVAAGLDAKFGPDVWLMGLAVALTLAGRGVDRLLARREAPAWRLLAAAALGAAWFALAPVVPFALLPGAWIVGQVLVHANIDLAVLRRLIGPIVTLMVGLSANIVAPNSFHPWWWLAALVIMCDARAAGVWIVTRLLGGRGSHGVGYACAAAIAGPTTLVVAWGLHDAAVIDAGLLNALVGAALISGLLGGVVMRLWRALRGHPA